MPKKLSPYPSIMLMTWIIQAIATRRRAKARFGMLRLLNSRGWRGPSAVAGLKPWGSLTAHDTAPGGVLVGRLCRQHGMHDGPFHAVGGRGSEHGHAHGVDAAAARRRAKARFGMLRLLNSRGWRGPSAVAGLKPWGSLTAHDTAPGGVLVGRLCRQHGMHDGPFHAVGGRGSEHGHAHGVDAAAAAAGGQPEEGIPVHGHVGRANRACQAVMRG